MAPKKTNKLPTGERPKQLSGLAYRTARDVGSASEGAAIAGRNRDFAKKQAAKKTSYSPAPMTAKKKETTRRAAEKKQAVTNIKKDVKKIAGAAGKAAGFVTKAAMAPSVGVTKVAKAGLKALTKEPRSTQRQFGKIKPMPKKSTKK
jgi:hypothetical protein